MSGAAQGAPGPALPGVRMEEPGWQERSLGLEEGLGFRLSRLARVMRAAWAAQLAGLGLTPPQAAILRGVAGHPGSSIRCLARLLGTDAMSVKRGADELERRDLLVSGSLTGDRRPRILQLSDRGTVLLGEIDALVRQQEQVFGVLGPAQRRHLIEAMTVLEARAGIGATPDGSQRCGAT
ncbi:MAG TPA: MarR family winged helix-turn-helix transcriptional regulator [Streptosporangiaceae bacterium]|nr:MarR family winged helix-turn-helix transcriptional regulator [Streptosporangiaceae bacterium]